MYIKIGDDTSKLWVIREHDSMYRLIQKIDIKHKVNSCKRVAGDGMATCFDICMIAIIEII